MASPILYTNCPINPKEFRLLEPVKDQDETLAYKFHVQPLEQCPAYTALSYTWGDTGFEMSKDPVPDVNIDGIPFPVRRNLRDFLEQARLDDDIGLLWIDAICINQKDNVEKSAQVKRMGDIYSKATEVHAWFGKGCKKTDIIFNVLQEFRDRRNTEEIPDDYDEAHRLAYYEDLFCDIYQDKAGAIPEKSDSDDYMLKPEFNWLRPLYELPYWSRVWIVQELVLAKDVLVRCGKKSIDFDLIYGLSLDWGPWEFSFDTGNYQKLKPQSRGWSTIQAIRGHRRRREAPLVAVNEMPRQDDIAELDEVIKVYAQYRGCEDPRDKVYGFRELIPQWKKKLVVDYDKSVRNVFLDVANLDNLNLFSSRKHGGWQVAFCLWKAMQLDCSRFDDCVKDWLPDIYRDHEFQLQHLTEEHRLLNR